jgi:hypothetical protein
MTALRLGCGRGNTENSATSRSSVLNSGTPYTNWVVSGNVTTNGIPDPVALMARAKTL